MIRHALFVSLLTLSLSGCLSSKKLAQQPAISLEEFYNLAQDKRVEIVLKTGQRINALEVEIGPDSTHYIHEKLWKERWGTVLTKRISYFLMEPISKEERKGRNAGAVGAGVGAGIGGAALLGTAIASKNCESWDCLGYAYLALASAISIPVLGILGGVIGSSASPYKIYRYYVFIDDTSRHVYFRELRAKS